MISLRYHAISIAAVFLALAVGVVLGASGVSERLLGALTTKADDLGGQVQALTVQRDELAASQRASDEFAKRVGPAVVKGTLQGQTVALVTASVDPADRDAVVALLGQAGATVTGEVALTDAVGDPARADQLRELTARLLPTGAQLPAAADTGSLAGGLLGGVLFSKSGTKPDQEKAVLSGLASAGFVLPGDPPAQANLALVLTGGALTGVDAPDAAAVVARLAAQLDTSGGGAVLAGRAGSSDATGAVGVARADPTITTKMSTVDNLQSGTGQLSTVLALRDQLQGQAGRYGVAPTAADGSSPQA